MEEAADRLDPTTEEMAGVQVKPDRTVMRARLVLESEVCLGISSGPSQTELCMKTRVRER